MAIGSLIFTILALGVILSRLAIALLFQWCERSYLVAIMTVHAPSGRRSGVVVDRRSPISWSDAKALHATAHKASRNWQRRPEPVVGADLGPYLQ